MAKVVRKQPSSRFPDLFDWLDTPWTSMLPFAGAHPLRLEEDVQDNKHIIRAELPGLDPDKDVDVTVNSGMLTIHAERSEEQTKPQRSEFRYGSFTRSVPLPDGADTDHITASYDKGILQVTVPVQTAKPAGHHVKITKTG